MTLWLAQLFSCKTNKTQVYWFEFKRIRGIVKLEVFVGVSDFKMGLYCHASNRNNIVQNFVTQWAVTLTLTWNLWQGLLQPQGTDLPILSRCRMKRKEGLVPRQEQNPKFLIISFPTSLKNLVDFGSDSFE